MPNKPVIKRSTHPEHTTTSNVTSPYKMVPLRYVLMPIGIVCIALFIFSIVKGLAEKPLKKPIFLQSPLVEVIQLERNNVTFKIKSQGSVSPRTKTVLVSEVSGRISSVADKFHVGGFFKKGEQLLTIDDNTYQAALVQAQSRLDAAEASLTEEKARGQQAQSEWLLTGQKLEQAPVLAVRLPQLKKAEADLLAAEADYKAAKIKLERTLITAPYDAVIQSKSADIGQYVSMGNQLGAIFAVDYAEIRLPIKPKDLDFIALPTINSNSHSALVDVFYKQEGAIKTWSTEIIRYEGVVDSQSRVSYVVAQLNDPYGLLSTDSYSLKQEIHIGSFVNAEITGKTLQNIIAIPRNAVRGANTVYMLDNNNTLNFVDFTPLRSDADFIYTRDSFNEAYRLILTKIAIPVQGMNLRIAEPKPEPKPNAIEITAEKESTHQGEG